ncbi:MAG: restriction endonuclease subunit S, partial [Fimbriimonadales bacterium]|nr:restriction endonuclease subunit S [Fimbriimonadales bacterium]
VYKRQLPEQRAIAHVLRTVQAAKEAGERVVEALRTLKKSLMRHLFTYGPVPIDDVARRAVPLRDTELGPLPEEWRVMRLGEITSIALGRTPSRAKAEYWEQGEVPWVSIADLTNGVVLSTKERISRKAFADVFRNQVIPAGTLLFSFKLTIGKVGILGFPAVHNEAIASLFVNESLANRDFLFFLMQSLDFSAYLDSYVKGRTLNKEKLGQIPLPLPPLAEQREIARMLQAVDRRIQAEEAHVRALEALFRTLLHELMTARRRLPAEFIAKFASHGDQTLPAATPTIEER